MLSLRVRSDPSQLAHSLGASSDLPFQCQNKHSSCPTNQKENRLLELGTSCIPTLGLHASHRLHVFRAWHRALVFPRVETVVCFPVNSWHRLHIFPHVAPVDLYVFPHLAPVACFPVLDTGCVFSRAWHRLRVFPCLAPVACFPALGTGCLFFRAWHRMHGFCFKF